MVKAKKHKKHQNKNTNLKPESRFLRLPFFAFLFFSRRHNQRLKAEKRVVLQIIIYIFAHFWRLIVTFRFFVFCKIYSTVLHPSCLRPAIDTARFVQTKNRGVIKTAAPPPLTKNAVRGDFGKKRKIMYKCCPFVYYLILSNFLYVNMEIVNILTKKPRRVLFVDFSALFAFFHQKAPLLFRFNSVKGDVN